MLHCRVPGGVCYGWARGPPGLDRAGEVADITQTALGCRVPGGMCYGWAMGVPGLFRPGALARTMCFTVLCASDLRHSAVEWSLAAV